MSTNAIRHTFLVIFLYFLTMSKKVIFILLRYMRILFARTVKLAAFAEKAQKSNSCKKENIRHDNQSDRPIAFNTARFQHQSSSASAPSSSTFDSVYYELISTSKRYCVFLNNCWQTFSFANMSFKNYQSMCSQLIKPVNQTVQTQKNSQGHLKYYTCNSFSTAFYMLYCIFWRSATWAKWLAWTFTCPRYGTII